MNSSHLTVALSGDLCDEAGALPDLGQWNMAKRHSAVASRQSKAQRKSAVASGQSKAQGKNTVASGQPEAHQKCRQSGFA